MTTLKEYLTHIYNEISDSNLASVFYWRINNAARVLDSEPDNDLLSANYRAYEDYLACKPLELYNVKIGGHQVRVASRLALPELLDYYSIVYPNDYLEIEYIE